MLLSWLGLLLILPLAKVAGERLRTKVANEIQSGSTRIGWYFHSDQWLADVRTFTAACQYVMEDDPDAPGQSRGSVSLLATPKSETTPSQSSAVEARQQPQKDS